MFDLIYYSEANLFLPTGILNFSVLLPAHKKKKKGKESNLITIVSLYILSYLPFSSPAQSRPEIT